MARFITIILLIVILLFTFKIDVRGYANQAWKDYIHPFITGETFSGLREKIESRNALPAENSTATTSSN